MSHTEPSKREKSKPRGRPFVKGHKRGQPENSILVDSRRNISDEGRTVEPNRVKFSKEPLKDVGEYIDTPETENEDSVLTKLPKLVMDGFDIQMREAMSSPTDIKEEEKTKIIDSMEFKNGLNNLSIRFSAVDNRRFRIQIFLNDETEVRPVTYNGSSSGYAFWKLLKGALKK